MATPIEPILAAITRYHESQRAYEEARQLLRICLTDWCCQQPSMAQAKAWLQSQPLEALGVMILKCCSNEAKEPLRAA